uniref:DRBM domain-containing protein n=1 Tax=Kalanchoe fedtschenkoi TaxID=63787 RepID=A0A7N1A4K5_KALFE
MYKNQLQELAQRSCFNLPAYTCIREGPDHAPRFKAAVNFNGEVFESPNYCTTLRQAEHSAAEVALSSLSSRGPTHSLAARILDESGVYKNLLQEVSQRVGAPLPVYHSFRSGLGHLPIFTGTVELAGVTFTGEPAKNKKQAEKNAAMAAWASLKQLAKEVANASTEPDNPDELEHVTVAKALLTYRKKERINAASAFRAPSLFPEHLLVKPIQPPSLPKPPPASFSKILSMICPRGEIPRYWPLSSDGQPSSQPCAMSPHAERRRGRRMAKSTARSMASTNAGSASVQSAQPDSFVRPTPPLQPLIPTMTRAQSPESWQFPVMTAAPYVPFSQMRMPYQTMAPPVAMRSAVPAFSPPALTSPGMASHALLAAHLRIPSPGAFLPAGPSFPPPSVRIEFPPPLSSLTKEYPPAPKIEAPPTLKIEDQLTPKSDNPPSPKKEDQNDLDMVLSLLPDEFLPLPHIELSVPVSAPTPLPESAAAASAMEQLHIK